jgi:prepilin-type N-terminal cleavage/methylation domain-containing protein
MMDIIKKDTGFTLLEVLIAMFVLAVGLLAVASMQITTIEGNDFSLDMTEAVILAQDEAENLATLDFDDAQLSDAVPGNWVGAPTNDFSDLSPMDPNFPNAEVLDMNNPANLINGVQYNIATYIEDNTPAPNVKTVAVVVDWTVRTPRQVIYRMTIAEPIL